MLRPELIRTKVEDVMSRVEWTVGPKDLITEVLGKMKKYNMPEIPVVEGERLRGFVKMRTLAKRRKIPLNAQTRSFMVSPPSVRQKDRIVDAAEMLITRDYTSIPVLFNTVLKGLVSRRDIIRRMRDDPSLEAMPLESIMNFAPLTVEPGASVFKALAQMELQGESSAAVVDDKNRFLGTVTSTSLARMMQFQALKKHGGTRGRKMQKDRTVESMAFTTKTLSRHSSVKDAADLLLDQEVPVVYVLDDSGIVGSVSEIDILEILLRGRISSGPLIQIAGVSEADLMGAGELNEIIQRYIGRIERVSEIKAVTVRIKHNHYTTYEDKYTVNVKVTLPSEVIVREGLDYDLATAIENAFKAVDQHAMKSHDRKVR